MYIYIYIYQVSTPPPLLCFGGMQRLHAHFPAHVIEAAERAASPQLSSDTPEAAVSTHILFFPFCALHSVLFILFLSKTCTS